MRTANIRGIDIMAVKNQTEFVDFLLGSSTTATGMLVAMNAEKVILCDEEPEIRTLLAQAEYKYADGISVAYAILQKYPQYAPLERIAGADLWLALMDKAAELQLPVFLVGGQASVLQQTIAKLSGQNVNVVGYHDGYFDHAQEQKIIRQIQQSGAKFVSVAMGSPKQERFMSVAKKYYPDALYMGVGGTYDVFVGKVKRAPKIWQKWGVEWLFRLLSQPTRWKRQQRLLKYLYYYLTKQL